MCRVWEVPRSTVYAPTARAAKVVVLKRRGPKPAWTDAGLLEKIRAVLAASPFVGEGHRTVWARLRVADVRTSRPRVLRLMREAHLLAPTRSGRARGPAIHDGTIIPQAPDVMWGTDATSCLTGTEFGGRHELYEVNYSGSHEEIRRYALFGALASGQYDRFKQFAESCMAEYDLNGWMAKDLVTPRPS